MIFLRNWGSGKCSHLRRTRWVMSQFGYYRYSRNSVIFRSIRKQSCYQEKCMSRYTHSALFGIRSFGKPRKRWVVKMDTGFAKTAVVPMATQQRALLITGSTHWGDGGSATTVTQADRWLVETYKFPLKLIPRSYKLLLVHVWCRIRRGWYRNTRPFGCELFWYFISERTQNVRTKE
jgi:hypothetical protein